MTCVISVDVRVYSTYVRIYTTDLKLNFFFVYVVSENASELTCYVNCFTVPPGINYSTSLSRLATIVMHT